MDEREIEAVARALYEQGLGFDIDADPVARESMFSVARVVLDRVRDARGDDEVQRLRAINAELVEAHNTLLVEAARFPQDEDHEAGIEAAAAAGCGGDGKDSGNATTTRAEPVALRRTPSAVHASHGYTWVPIEDLRQAEAERDEQSRNALASLQARMDAEARVRELERERLSAWSPQSEDHEAVSHWECECGQRVEWKFGAWFCPTHRDSAVVHPIPVPSPSRVGSVAVEDIATWLRSDEAEHIRSEAVSQGVPPEDALAHAIEQRFGHRAEFSRSSTDNQPQESS
jgi:hypothetical protein